MLTIDELQQIEEELRSQPGDRVIGGRLIEGNNYTDVKMMLAKEMKSRPIELHIEISYWTKEEGKMFLTFNKRRTAWLADKERNPELFKEILSEVERVISNPDVTMFNNAI